MARVLTSLQCGLGSILVPNIICELRLLLVLVLAPIGFFFRVLRFPFLHKKTTTDQHLNVPIRFGVHFPQASFDMILPVSINIGLLFFLDKDLNNVTYHFNSDRDNIIINKKIVSANFFFFLVGWGAMGVYSFFVLVTYSFYIAK